MAITRASMARVGIAFAAILLLFESAGAQAPVPLANPGFEVGVSGQPPPGWIGPIDSAAPGGGAASAYRAVIDAESPREGRASVRLERVGDGEGSAPFGSLAQTVDAKPYRGRRVRLTAAVRTTPGPTAQVGLWLRVDREAGRLGFFDNMNDRPITSTQWTNYAIEGDVASDAERIVLGLLVVGDGRAWIDAVSLDDLGPATPSASNVDLRAYVDQAFALLRQLHINSALVDWDAIAARTSAQLTDASQLSDAQNAIRDIIADLGEPHTFLRPAQPSEKAAGSSAAMPDYRLIEGRFGIVRLPGFSGSPEQAEQYTATLREGLTSMDGRNVCGWIIDLRDNTGGNMWPMLRGLDPLLGAGPFGAFRTPSGQQAYWVRGDDTIRTGNAPVDRSPFFTLRSANAPVAVLLGPRTSSSGEMVAIALAGRPDERSFGANSSGFSTANTAVPLSDGALLVITTAFARDRTGHEYSGPIIPNEQAEEGAAEEAAARWLSSQGRC